LNDLHGAIQKFLKFEFCANGYKYIEIPIGVCPQILLESVRQVASSSVVGLNFRERTSIVVFPSVCGFAISADMGE
jgi:hypothetical protein